MITNTYRAIAFVAAFVSAVGPLSAGPRASGNYSIPAESVGVAGGRAQSAGYAINGSAVGEFGAGAVSVVSSAAYSMKTGFVGELYEITGLSVTSPPSNALNEGSNRQLVAAPQADDGSTTAALNPANVTWSVVNGPITSITTAGVATAGTVFQDTPAAVGASASSLSGQLNLTVSNVNFDDFGAYAGDQIDDSWQVQYFGQPPNSLAGPTSDPDSDGQNNRFEFTAGLIPNDPKSRFVLSIQPVIGQPGQKSIVFNPLASGRTYAVEFRTNLTTGTWSPLTGTTQSDNGTTRTVNDLSASSAPKFYRVQIAKP